MYFTEMRIFHGTYEIKLAFLQFLHYNILWLRMGTIIQKDVAVW